MTDNEIIKALECCIKAETLGDCEEMGCPASTKQGCRFYLRTDADYENTIYIEILKDALDLINRQKAEIEKLTINMNAFGLSAIREKERADTARAEAIKEFAERLKKTYENHIVCDWRTLNSEIDNLVKEMVGEDK